MSWFLKRGRAVYCLALAAAWGCSTGQQEAQRRIDYVDSHPKISEVMAQSILDEEVLVGMDQSMVTASWGNPSRTEIGEIEGEPMTLWIYGNVWNGEPLTHLFFDADQTLVKFEVSNPLQVAPGDVVSKPHRGEYTREQKSPAVKESP